MNGPFAADFGSAVMPVGKPIFDPNWLLDELELRLTRYDLDRAESQVRAGGSMMLSVAEGFFRTADLETSNWWYDHGLCDADEQTQREILLSMLVRSPKQLGWAAVTLLAHLGAHLLDSEVVVRVTRWVTSVAVTRWIRDGVALSLIVPWFERQSEGTVIGTLVELCESENTAEIRMGLMGAAAYLRKRTEVSGSMGQTLLALCRRLASRTDAETACAVGWVLRELLTKDERRFYPELLSLANHLSRQAMRTAVERLDRERRQRVTAQWRRAQSRRGVAVDR